LQVHDELVFEMPEDEVNNLIPQLKSLMENIASLRIPLVIGVGIGDNWQQAH
jgi:DNA polymerase-1